MLCLSRMELLHVHGLTPDMCKKLPIEMIVGVRNVSPLMMKSLDICDPESKNMFTSDWMRFLCIFKRSFTEKADSFDKKSIKQIKKIIDSLHTDYGRPVAYRMLVAIAQDSINSHILCHVKLKHMKRAFNLVNQFFGTKK